MINILEDLRRPVYELPHADSTAIIYHFNNDTAGTVERFLTRYKSDPESEADAIDFFKLTAEEWKKVCKPHTGNAQRR